MLQTKFACLDSICAGAVDYKTKHPHTHIYAEVFIEDVCTDLSVQIFSLIEFISIVVCCASATLQIEVSCDLQI